MKRYVCTVVTGLLLALVSTGTATASILPPLSLPGDSGKQETNLLPGPPGKEEEESGQSVEQENDADVDNKQTNKNILSPPIAIAVLGDAEASNEQSNKAGRHRAGERQRQPEHRACGGDLRDAEASNEQSNGKTATENDGQANSADQVSRSIRAGERRWSRSQSRSRTAASRRSPATTPASRRRTTAASPSARSSASRSGEYGRESSSGGQSVKQENDADVDNKQTNANVLSPPVALGILGKAEAENEQTNVSTDRRYRAGERRRSSESRAEVVRQQAVLAPATPTLDAGRRLRPQQPECSSQVRAAAREYGSCELMFGRPVGEAHGERRRRRQQADERQRPQSSCRARHPRQGRGRNSDERLEDRYRAGDGRISAEPSSTCARG